MCDQIKGHLGDCVGARLMTFPEAPAQGPDIKQAVKSARQAVISTCSGHKQRDALWSLDKAATCWTYTKLMFTNQSPTEMLAGLTEIVCGLLQLASEKRMVPGVIAARAWLGFQLALGAWMLTWTASFGAVVKARVKVMGARVSDVSSTAGLTTACEDNIAILRPC